MSSMEVRKISKRTSILIIEDDRDDFFLTEDVLKSVDGQPYKISWSSSFEAAQQILSEQEFDVALVDYQIGPRTGLDFISEVGPSYPNTPMVLLTGLRSTELDLAAQAAGAADYICKDSLSAELLDRTIRYTRQHAERWSLLHSILNNTPTGMIAVDASMNPIIWNEQALQALNINNRFKRVSSSDITVELGYIMSDGHLPDTFRNALGQTFEIRFSDVPGVGHIFAFHDISERADAERLLHRAVAEAEEANSQKSKFLETMTHELRTPLNGILGMVEVLQRGSLTAEQIGRLDSIKGCSEGLLRIINDILDLSKIEAGAMEIDNVEFDVSDLVDNTVHLLAPNAFAKNLEISAFVDPALWTVMRGDPLRLNQVLTNLVGNAIKFTPSGAVSVCVSEVDADDHRVIRFEVTDTGPGISADLKKHLFQRFKQLDNSPTSRACGTGLGLALSKEIISLMQGEIGCDSVEGEGSRFWFEIPVETSNHAQIRLARRQRTDLAGHSFLLISSEPSLQQTASAYISALGGQAHAVADENDALLSIEQSNFTRIIFDRFACNAEPIRVLDLFRQNCPDGQVWKLQDRMQIAEVHDVFDSILERPLTKTAIAKLCSLDGQQESVQPVPVRESGESKPKDRELRILMAEDNTANQEVARAVLASKGYAIEIARDGHEAVEMAAAGKHDVILMDVCMPGLDGIQATNQIRSLATGSDVPIIGLTADVSSKTECIEAGMDLHLMKPLNWDDLLSILNELDAVKISLQRKMDQPIAAQPLPIAQ